MDFKKYQFGKISPLLAALIFILGTAVCSAEGINKVSDYHVYVGAYTGKDNPGITRLAFNGTTGELKTEGNAAETTNPSFVTVSADGKYLYTANEIDNFGGKKSGAVSAYRIDRGTGALQFLNSAGSGGSGPCYVSVNKQNTLAVTANYGSGSAGAVAIRPDGSLGTVTDSAQHTGQGKDPKRQAAPHTHSSMFAPGGKFVLSADLGVDKVYVYKTGDEGKLEPHTPAIFECEPGSGPRHIAFHPTASTLYISNELNNTITACHWDKETGVISSPKSLSTLPSDFHGTSYVAEVAVHPSGKFVYVSNRGHNSIAEFLADEKSGDLKLVGHTSTDGDFPRGFTISPDGRWIIAANQKSDSLVVFKIDQESGKLTRTGNEVRVSKPVSIVFVAKE